MQAAQLKPSWLKVDANQIITRFNFASDLFYTVNKEIALNDLSVTQF